MLPTFILAFVMLAQTTIIPVENPIRILGEAAFPLTDRYSNTYVSNVFADNILLTLAYMRGIVTSNAIDWATIEAPFTYSFTLQPGEVFAFHNDVLPEFEDKVVKTTNAHFGAQEGFKSDGYLVADGVCHLASLINEAATRAGLKVVAPTNHDFAIIPDVDKKYGTAIYFMPGEKETNEKQNLYVENTQNVPVTFTFTYKDSELEIRITDEE